MAYQAIPPVQAGGAGSMSDALNRAKALLGVNNITKVMGTEFDNDQWYRTVLTNGSVTPTTTKSGGVVTLASSATVSSSAYVMPHGTIDLISSMTTTYWYVRSRFAVTSAINNTTSADLRMTIASIGAPQIGFGVVGGTSTAFFGYFIQNNAGTVNVNTSTTVAVDTAMHVFEVWGDTVNFNFAIDGVTVATSAVSNGGSNPVTPSVEVSNGATATNRTIDLDYLWVCTGNPS